MITSGTGYESSPITLSHALSNLHLRLPSQMGKKLYETTESLKPFKLES